MTILLIFVLCFFTIAPILVAYSMGYRYDLEKMKIVATGGIYVRTFPTAEQIIIDERAPEKPGMFANSIFAQSLLPKNHTVFIKKSGYYDYSKTLPVQENQVTKLENVLLIKNNIIFSSVAEKASYFSISPNNQNIITSSSESKNTSFSYFSLNSTSPAKTFSVAQTGTVSNIKWSDNSNTALISIQNSTNTFYYLFDSTLAKPSAVRMSYLDKNSQQISFNPQDSKNIFYIQNNTLYSATGNNSLPIINDLISYKISGANIVWLSLKGVLLNSDFSGKLISKITLQNFTADPKKKYEIISISGNTFLKENSSLFKLNQETKTFESFIIPAIFNYEILNSPDNKNLIYYSQNKIYLYSVTEKKYFEIFSGSKIANLQWLNNNYIIFNAGDKVMISEIDYRGNINAITLTQTATSIFFNHQTEKLYILADDSLLVSEKLTP